MLRVGLTGGIACGKSEVLRRLARAGLRTLDLDRMAHELMAPGGPAFDEVVSAFGRGILGADGAIDRKALGAVVFADPSARQRLDGIVHPRVREEESRRASSAAKEGADLLVTDAALLVEAGLHLRFDRLVVVHCRPEQQVARLMARDGVDEAAARARLRAQMPIETKRRFAHLAVDTSTSRADTHRAADALAEGLRVLATRRPPPISLGRERVRAALFQASEEAGRRGSSEEAGPRGLSVAEVAAHLVRTGGLELGVLGAGLEPPASGPWWKAADEALVAGASSWTEADAVSLTVPVVLHELARHGYDEERIAAAAHSLAWLTERSPERLASSVMYALAFAHVVGTGGAGLESQGESFVALARHWGGGEPGPAVMAAVRYAARPPEGRTAARSNATQSTGTRPTPARPTADVEPALSGALLAAGVADPRAAEREPLRPDAFAAFVDAVGR